MTILGFNTRPNIMVQINKSFNVDVQWIMAHLFKFLAWELGNLSDGVLEQIGLLIIM
mgnify:FL=1